MPLRAQPAEVRLPWALVRCAVWLFQQSQAAQVIVFDGGGRLVVGESDAELPPGRWLVVQLADESEPLPPNTLYTVPND